MSRIGKRKLTIPAGVTVDFKDHVCTVKGAKGELSLNVSPLINVVITESEIETVKVKDTKEANIMQGTTNSLILNILIGVSEGFQKGLEIVGVGYRFNVQGKIINVNAGFSHPVAVTCPEGINVTQVNNTEITLDGIDKQKVSKFAAEIRDLRRPEPYKGKGIRYKGEVIRRKEGKKAAK